MANLIKLGQGEYDNYAALASKSQYEVYFTTDTHQIFVADQEYTKGTKVLNAAPIDGTTSGDQDRLYAYDGSLYLCTSAEDKTWLRVANINDTPATVTSIEVGEGLTTASGSTSITTTDEIKHAVPTGASTVADDLSDQTPAFGSTFAIKGVATDKFGHVTAISDHAVTIPVETKVTTAAGTTAASTLVEGDSFTVITGVSATGNDHEVTYNTTTFTLPSDVEHTYEISSTTEGVVTLTDDTGAASTALINGWNDLAKKSDLTAVFKFKGTKATASELPTTADVGDVWYVTEDQSEWVCVDDATNPATWEKLGPIVDLSAYATTAYVDEKLTWHTF